MLSPNWSELRKDFQTDSFWSRALKDNNVKWTNVTIKLILASKALAAGSSVCESGFSILSAQKTKLRSRLTNTHLSDLLNVLINGPESIDYFDEYLYADKYIKSGGALAQNLKRVERKRRSITKKLDRSIVVFVRAYFNSN